MSDHDWMDELRETLGEELKLKLAGEASKQQSEEQLRRATYEIFSALEDKLKTAVPTFNQTVFGGKRWVELRYIDNTITGDHFIVLLSLVRYVVRMKADEHKIKATWERYSIRQEKHVTASADLKDFTITTDGKQILLREQENTTPVTIDEIVRHILTTLARDVNQGPVRSG